METGNVVVPTIHQIVCVDQNGGIGKGGKLPWKIEKDWKYFLNTSLRIQVNNLNNIFSLKSVLCKTSMLVELVSILGKNCKIFFFFTKFLQLYYLMIF